MTRLPKQLAHVGTIEYIDLPADGIFGVPAKVDTGADSSAVWASNIRETSGTLSFVLFDRASSFYTGRVITTQKYTTASIKNSFGQTEFRYKVTLPVTLAGQKLRVRFTLANRVNNRYPVLIGRRTLHGKFLVDVTLRPEPESFQTLLLTTWRTANVRAFVAGLEAVNPRLHITLATYKDLYFVSGNGHNTVTLHRTGKDIASFDMVHFKTTARHLDIAAAAARYLASRRVRFFDQAVADFPSTSKLYQYVILNDNGIKTPQSLFVPPQRMEKLYEQFRAELGVPFVLKDIHGSKGKYNYLIKNEADFVATCQEAARQSVQLIGQSFVANDGDYRVLVLGRKVPLMIYRSRTNNHTHLNNTSQGGRATLASNAEVPAKVQNLCMSAAALLERDVAGVDMVQDKTTEAWYCLEVNDGPQIASGSFLPEKWAAFAAYMEYELKK